MAREGCVIMDINEIIDPLNAEGRFHPSVIESWLARLYAKNHSVPCISLSLFDGAKDAIPFERLRLTITAQRLCINPIDYLPYPERNWQDDEGIWFLVRGRYLAMGNSRAVERCWRQMHR